jgi:hypothetical protein
MKKFVFSEWPLTLLAEALPKALHVAATGSNLAADAGGRPAAAARLQSLDADDNIAVVRGRG